MIDAPTFWFGFVTFTLSIWAFFRGRCGVDIIGALTFVGWVYYQIVTRAFHFSLEQAWLAPADAAECLALLIIISKNGLGRVPFFTMLSAFSAMICLHLMCFLREPASFHYHTSLNYAYALQLMCLGGMALRDELAHRSYGVGGGLAGSDRPGRSVHR